MELIERRTVQRLLKQYGVAPRKHWGQNFLVSRPVVNRLLNAADVQPNETVLEIGAGLGALTVELAKRARRVIAVERDPNLCRALHDILAPHHNVELICADARKLNAYPLSRIPYALVANLPYGVGTVILRQLLESDMPPTEAVVVLQREVAERICARPPKMALPSVVFQHLAETRIIASLPREACWPIPEVNSAVVRLRLREPRPSRDAHRRIVSAAKRGFLHSRKYVLRNLADDATLREVLAERCGIPPTARAQELALSQWQCLADALGAR